MNSRSRWICTLVVLFALGQQANGAEQDSPEPEFTFTLDGAKFTPKFHSPSGKVDRPRAGDLIDVEQIRLLLGKQRKLDFVSTPREDGRLMLKMPDGTTKVVGVNVKFTYVDKKRVSINPLAKLSPAEIRGLRGIRFSDWPAEVEWQLEHIDPANVCVTITDLASVADPKQLPPLPAKLRYLNVDESSNRGYTDLSGLKRFESLQCLFLDLMTLREFDLGLVEQSRDLRLLSVSCRRVQRSDALASLEQLRSLYLGYCRGITSVEFARKTRHLRRVDLRSTDVLDLSPFDAAVTLEYLNAQISAAEQLPAGDLPALRELRVFSAPLPEGAAAAFAQSHPECKVYYRWMEAFRDEVAQVDQLRVRTGGTCHRNVSREETLFEIDNPAAIQKLLGQIELDEQASGVHCMCCGEPSFEFYDGERLVAMVGFHHGRSIRWIGGWPADGVLTKKSAAVLVSWLADNGVTEPQEALEKERRRTDAMSRRYQRIFEVVPKQVTDKLKQAKSPDDALAAFTTGVPDPVKRAEVCFRVLGCDIGTWNHYTQFETLVCRGLLPEIGKADLATALADASEDRVLADGAARWLFAERKPETVTAKAFAKALPALAEAGLSHPRTANRIETMLALGRLKSPDAIQALRDCVDGKYEVRELPADSVEPPGQVVFHPRKVKVSDKYSDGVNAALVLVEADDRESLSRIRKLLRNAKGAEKKRLQAGIERLEKP